MHAPELPEILKAGSRVVTISNEHPEALERLMPTEAHKSAVLAAANLKQTVPAKEVVKDYLGKVGIVVADDDIDVREVGERVGAGVAESGLGELELQIKTQVKQVSKSKN